MNLGAVLALLVLLGCFVIWISGKALTPGLTLAGIAALALAMVLGGVGFPTFWRSSPPSG